MKTILQLQASLLVSSLLFSLPLNAADVSYYAISRLQRYQQTPTTTPTVLASNGYVFTAFVVASSNSLAINSATVKPSNATPLRTLALNPLLDTWSFEESFDTQDDLNTTYPAGLTSYTMTVNTLNDGTHTAALSFLGISTPATPRVANLNEGQAIDTAQDFVLRWDPLAGGSALDVLQVLVLDLASNVVFASPAPFDPGALNGTSTSIVIPANTLPLATNLMGSLITAKPGLPNLTSYPGATGIAAVGKETGFPLVTRSTPTPPRLEVVSVDAAPFRFEFQGESNRNYYVQVTTNLQAWQDLLMTNSPTGTGIITDAQSGSFPQRFYRIQVRP